MMKYAALILCLLPFFASAESSVTIRQSGGGANKATIIQKGKVNRSKVYQEGTNNQLDQTQEGDDNYSDTTQIGKNNASRHVFKGKRMQMQKRVKGQGYTHIIDETEAHDPATPREELILHK